MNSLLVLHNSNEQVYLSEVWSPDVGHQVLRLINPHGARSQKLFNARSAHGQLHYIDNVIPLYRYILHRMTYIAKFSVD